MKACRAFDPGSNPGPGASFPFIKNLSKKRLFAELCGLDCMEISDTNFLCVFVVTRRTPITTKAQSHKEKYSGVHRPHNTEELFHQCLYYGRKAYIRLVSYYVKCRRNNGSRGRGVGAPFCRQSMTENEWPLSLPGLFFSVNPQVF